MKLRKLLDFPEPLGDFLAFVPGSRKQQSYPSTVSYLARLVLHRYAMLGLLDEDGVPVKGTGLMQAPVTAGARVMRGLKCPECGAFALIRKDGCDWCSSCGYTGICG
jgi:ribonucleoside-diphosphate reductase alpha chain